MENVSQIAIHANPLAILSFIFYLAIIVAIGVLATKFSSAGISEFFIGGRKMKEFVVALSAVVSGRSAWLLVGVTGMAYIRGASAIWAVAGYIIVELFLFLFLAKRLRRYTEKMDNLTIPDFFESRYKDKSNVLRIISVVIILIFMVAYVSAQFNAGGKAFGASFGLGEFNGVLVTALIVLAYTMMGGFLAVSLTDMVQAFFMIIGLLILPVIAIIKLGGWSDVLTALSTIDPEVLGSFSIDPFALSAGGIIGFLGIGLGSPGNPHILVRYMSIDDPRALRKSALIGTVWNTLMAWGAIYIGIVGRAYYPAKNLLPNSDPENLFPYLASTHLHPILFGIIIASIFAAIMSTADSQLLVAASGVVRDIYQKIMVKGKEISQKKLVLLSRVVIILLVVIALILGAVASQLVFWLVLFAWAGLGASFGPTIILSLFWKRTTKQGVIAGFISGTLITIIW
ncbi:sodium/proline symporter, partial [Candidatus Aminicenantes bacterium AC-335-B20]|nr:sodium/proline symporter [Candidatus Aminicenantes bacterium AC-335-B20]